MMSSSDAIIWNIEKDPQLRSTVMVAWLLDEAPTHERMTANLDRMIAAIPRLRQRVAPGRPRPLWDPIDQDELDLDHHYIQQQMHRDADFDDVLAFAQDWVREPFDRSRPLWRLALLTGLTNGKAAIVIKIHHAIADGMGMLLMLGAFTDFERHPAPAALNDAVSETAANRPVFSPVHRAAAKASHAVRAVGSAPVTTLRSTGATLVSAARLVTPHRTPHSELMTNRSEHLSMATRSIDLAVFRAKAKASDISINDLFISLMADALLAHHTALGVACPRLRVHMPVDARTSRTANLAGNQFVPARVSLDLRAESSGLRRRRIAAQLRALRDEPALGHINSVSAAIQRLGKPVSRFIIGGMMKGVDLLASNVQGPNFPLYIAGSQIERFIPFGPPAGAALNATLFSYDSSVGIGLTLDDQAMVDADAFLQCLDQTIAATFPTAADESLRSAS